MSPRPDAYPPAEDDAGVPSECELCARAVPELTKHHLIPRKRHRHKGTRRRYGRQVLQGSVLWVCRSCHDHIHVVFSEKELAESRNTREALLAHPEIRRFVDWIAGKPPAFATRSRGGRHRR